MPISALLRQMLETVKRTSIVEGGSFAPNDPNRPDYVADFYKAQVDDVEYVRDVYGGTKSLRSKDDKYLPRHAAESKGVTAKVDPFHSRKSKAVLYNALGRTAQGLTGMVVRKDVILKEDVPPVIAQHAENIDLHGRNLPVFARDVLLSGVLDGHTFVHVEFPDVDEGSVQTRADERAAGVRPYWTHVLKEALINARWTYINGEPVMTLAVYTETMSEDVGAFGQEEKLRYRVLLPGAFKVFQKEDENKFEIVDEGDVSLPYIPLYTFYTNRKGMLDSCPPLLDLAYENVGHFQLRSDYRHALELTCFPLLFAAGLDEGESLVIGPNWSLRSENPNAKAEWIEPAGSSLEKVRQELQDIEGRMASLGLQMLVQDTRAAETAESKRISSSERDASLAQSARNLGDTLENCLQAHADFLSLPSGGSVEVNMDFRGQEMTPEMINTLSGMVEKSQLSIDTMWQRMQDGEVLPSDFDPELEKERIDEQDIAELVDFVERTKAEAQARNGEPVADE